MTFGVSGFPGVGEQDVAVVWSEVARRVDAEYAPCVTAIDEDEQELTDAATCERSVLNRNPAN